MERFLWVRSDFYLKAIFFICGRIIAGANKDPSIKAVLFHTKSPQFLKHYTHTYKGSIYIRCEINLVVQICRSGWSPGLTAT